MTEAGRVPVVLITGAARGIGLETARRLAADGFRVAGFDLLEPEEPELFARFFVDDLRDLAAVRSAVDELTRTFDGIDGLVNNAAVAPVALFLEARLEDLDAAYAVNVRALFAISQLVARAMTAKGGGSIVNLASVNAERGVAGTSIYSTTKGSVAALTRTLAMELAPHGIRCNAVAPSPTGTRRVLESLSSEQLDVRVRRIPMGRLANPQEVADAVSFLLSPRAAFLTGITLPVDGGYLAYGS